jgi:exonuclease III
MNTMAMLHINAQSLRNKVDELELESEGFDIVAITETWLKPEITPDDVKLPGYNMIRRDRIGDAHGGVALYTRENIIVKERADLHIPDLEAIWAEILVENRKILICCMYRPPNALAGYWNKVEASLEQAKSTGINHIFLLGDLNCNMFVKGNTLNQILEDMHMTQLINDSTHRTAYSETLIDIIATNSLDLVDDIKIKEPSLSNHCDVAALIKIRTHKQQGIKRTVYNYEKANWQGLSRAVEHFDWEDKHCNNMNIGHWKDKAS